MAIVDEHLKAYFYGHADREALAWCDQLLAAKLADLESRAGAAFHNDQPSLNLALLAQAAVVRLLKEQVRAEFWRRTHIPPHD